MGLQKLVDTLRDKREEVRNELLTLLRFLTRRNEEICKYIAFQDGFDILISILKKEEGMVARDCLNIIYNMIANSVLTLKLFSQSSCFHSFLLLFLPLTSRSSSARSGFDSLCCRAFTCFQDSFIGYFSYLLSPLSFSFFFLARRGDSWTGQSSPGGGLRRK